jgi:tripartite-type tricarboxylate transporter receptor subunit TctC
MRRRFLAQMAALACGTTARRTFAQSIPYPDRPIRVIVAFAPAGAVDPAMRAIQARMSEFLGQPIVVENRPGGTTSIAAGAVTRAAADGYTLLFTAANTHVSHTISAAHIHYDPIKDFTAIAGVSRSGYALAVHPSIPANDVAGLVAYCRENPGKLSFASSGIGNADHLIFERFNLLNGIKAVHVPYKAAATAYLDLLAGRIDAYFSAVALLEPGIEAGKLRGLAYTAPENEAQSRRTFTAAGLPELDGIDSLNILLGPPNLPPAIVSRLQAAARSALEASDVQATMKAQKQTAYFIPGTQLSERMSTTLATFKQVVKDANIKLQE